MNRNLRSETNEPSTTDSASDTGRAAACCGGPAPAGADACCVQDAEVKSAGGAGCGCSPKPPSPPRRKTSCC
jgi:hypothetical protein